MEVVYILVIVFDVDVGGVWIVVEEKEDIMRFLLSWVLVLVIRNWSYVGLEGVGNCYCYLNCYIVFRVRVVEESFFCLFCYGVLYSYLVWGF